MFNGLRIIESVYAEVDGEPVARVAVRTWRDRLLSADDGRAWYQRSWHPFMRERRWTETPKVPAMYQLGSGTIVAHPALVAELRRQFAQEG